MLQWMGGSRRKVASSRKSTHNRQKQYFEQRKRQQQLTGLENIADRWSKRTHYHEEPRSLDILNLINLTTAQQEVGAQVDPHSSKISPEIVLKSISSTYSKDLERACSETKAISPNKLPLDIDHQKIPSSSSKLSKRKLPTSSCDYMSMKTDKKLCEPKEELHHEVSILDLLDDDGPKGTSHGRSVPEAHVALSVEGLGKVGFGTPAQSPKLEKREPPLPPKPSRWTQTSKSQKSSSFDIMHKWKEMVHDTGDAQDCYQLESECNTQGMLDEDFCTNKNLMFSFSCISPDAYGNQFEILDNVEDSLYNYTEGLEEQLQNDAYDISNASFLDEEYDATWKNSPFPTERFSTFNSKSRKYDTSAYGLRESLSPNNRTFPRAGKISNKPVSSATYFKQMTSENEYIPTSSGQQSQKVGGDTMFSQPGWSAFVDDDSQDRMSLLSEESCSSAAGRKARGYDVGPHSQKLEGNNIKHEKQRVKSAREEYGLGKFSAEGMNFTDLDERFQEKNLVGSWSYKSMQEKWNATTGNCEFKGMLEPDVSLSEEVYDSAKGASPTSFFHRNYMESDTSSFSHKLMSEDELFKLFPEPSTKLIHREAKTEIPMNHEPLNSFKYETEILRPLSGPNIQLQKPGMLPFETEDNFPFSSSNEDSQKDIQFPGILKQKTVDKNSNKDERGSEKSQNKDSSGDNSISSNWPTAFSADGKKKCSENVELVGKTQEIFDGEKTTDLSDRAEVDPREMEEAPSQLESCIDDRQIHFNRFPSVPSQVRNKGSTAEKFEPESKNVGSKGGSTGSASYQVMLGSYVLQLLCVQTVLLEKGKGNEKNIG